jgi:tetratricopeptide (TPR) repeat protein
MKKLLITYLLLTVGTSIVSAQIKQNAQQIKPAEVKQAPAANPLAEHFIKKYTIANRWGDMEVSKDALYDLIIEFPGNDSLIFSLALLYYENQKYASSALISQDLLARNSKNAGALELAGESYQALNILDKALPHYESLYLETSNLTVLYKMAFIQLQLKRFQEALTNADILIGKQDSEKLMVVFATAENKEKEYMMKIAVLNLKGMIYREMADKVNAKKFFEQALALAPDFLPAKKNLADLK